MLVQVVATSVNPADWRLRSGQFRLALRLRFPFVPGSDVAGTVAPESIPLPHAAALAPLRGGRRLHSVLVEPDGARLTRLCHLVDTGKLRPVVHTTVPWPQLAEGHRLVAAGRLTGKVVVKVADE